MSHSYHSGGGGRGGGASMGNGEGGMHQGGHNPAAFGGMPMNVSPEMINMGFSAGQDMLNRQREKWMPGMASFWTSLKYYFAVNKTFVLRKLKILLFPPSSTHWSRIPADESAGDNGNAGGDDGSGADGSDLGHYKWALPKDDVNSPDLYIPCMAFVSYCILLCYSRGSAAGANTPEVLIQAVWKCCLLQVCEALLISFGLSMVGVNSVPVLDIVAYTGYKYVGLCVSTLAWFLGSTVYFLAVLYTSAMLGYFVLKSLAAVVPREVSGPLPRHIMLLLFAALQFLISVVLCCY